ncbi:hypothetical protein [Pedobacter steynii]|uniref:Uncharacterized protein n=1 Tax=Pedobacter steynii TaxID=430522 RepID=A0A1D7QFK3_9SPHI|nr:hypothetical protein [Pedobacter steynii]AOM77405.1 hypothetical protein BFS30_09635 [Pedobacter steynii]
MSTNLKPLTSTPFLICLFLLLLNDFYFKSAFHNSLTGKLSDLCGLFIFPIFWSVLFPKRKQTVYILTALFFIYWKSSYSDPFIQLFSLYVFPIDRTIDPNDLFALIVLPVSWHLQSRPPKRSYFNPQLVGLVAFFSFCATSMPRPSLYFEQPQYVLFPSPKHLPDTNFVDPGIKFYKVDTLLAVQVDQIGIGREPVKYDDFNKNQVLKDLEQRVLAELNVQYPLISPEQVNHLTIKTARYQDYLMFKGSRLHGKFLRKNQDQVLIDGQFKNGIEDSVWTFVDPSRNAIIKKTFDKGETTRIEEFTSSKLTSSKSVNTRKETSIFKGAQLALLLGLCIAIVIRLRKNYKNNPNDVTDMKTWHKVLICLGLPILTWFIQLVISTIIPDNYSPAFIQVFILFLSYLIGTPIFAILLFWLKPKQPTDILWYCLLLSLLLVFWQQTNVLSLLLEN